MFRVTKKCCLKERSVLIYLGLNISYKEIMRNIKIKNIIMLTIAGFINAFGVTVFLSPVKLYDSGISGTAMLLSQITPEWCSLSVFLLLLNIPLFIFGYKKQGAYLPYILYIPL